MFPVTPRKVFLVLDFNDCREDPFEGGSNRKAPALPRGYYLCALYLR